MRFGFVLVGKSVPKWASIQEKSFPGKNNTGFETGIPKCNSRKNNLDNGNSSYLVATLDRCQVVGKPNSKVLVPFIPVSSIVFTGNPTKVHSLTDWLEIPNQTALFHGYLFKSIVWIFPTNFARPVIVLSNYVPLKLNF